VFERAKAVHVLDRAATVIGLRDRPRLVCCEDGWMDLVEEASFGVSKVKSGYFKYCCSHKPNEKINDSADMVLDSF
jgi:hypothetical protein